MASNKRDKKKSSKKNSILLSASSIGLIIGYFLLNHVATWEDPVLGNTFYIISGCALIAISALVLFLTLKKMYFPSKRKKHRSRQVFLKDLPKKDNE